MSRQFLLICLCTLCSLSLSFLTGGSCGGGCGGGGGGCGGGCGGCGRKKRSIEDATPQFTNLASSDKDMLCNSPELREIMQRSFSTSMEESGKRLSAVLEQHGDRYVVVCSQNAFSYFVRPDTEYCGIRNGTYYCQAFAL